MDPRGAYPNAQALMAPESAVDFGEPISAVLAHAAASPMLVDEEHQALGQEEQAVAEDSDAARSACGQQEPVATEDDLRVEVGDATDGYETGSEVGFPQLAASLRTQPGSQDTAQAVTQRRPFSLTLVRSAQACEQRQERAAEECTDHCERDAQDGPTPGIGEGAQTAEV